MNPITNITDPNNINAMEIPRNRDAKAAEETCEEEEEEEEGITEDGPKRAGNGIGKGDEPRM